MVDAVCQLDLNRFLFLQKCGLQKVPRSLSFYQIPVIISKTHPSFLGQLAYNKLFFFFFQEIHLPLFLRLSQKY